MACQFNSLIGTHSLSVVSVQTGGEEDWRLCSHQAHKSYKGCNFITMYGTFVIMLIALWKFKVIVSIKENVK